MQEIITITRTLYPFDIFFLLFCKFIFMWLQHHNTIEKKALLISHCLTPVISIVNNKNRKRNFYLCMHVDGDAYLSDEMTKNINKYIILTHRLHAEKRRISLIWGTFFYIDGLWWKILKKFLFCKWYLFFLMISSFLMFDLNKNRFWIVQASCLLIILPSINWSNL
jgi:hypothetical protein